MNTPIDLSATSSALSTGIERDEGPGIPTIKASELLVRLLEKEGVSTAFGLPGGPILPFYDALARSRIRHVLARHEQGAGFMAQGYARSSGKAGVCVVSSGPGVLNLLTALGDAYGDSVPLIALCGQVPAPLIGTDAFQECDTLALAASITKQAWRPQKAEELYDIIPLAFELALGGRPGPVLVDLPKDLLLQETALLPERLLPRKGDNPHASFMASDSGLPSAETGKTPDHKTGETLDRMARLIDASERPVCLIGGGFRSAFADERQARPFFPDSAAVPAGGRHSPEALPPKRGALETFLERSEMPAALTFMGLGSLDPEHPSNLGMLGMHGGAGTNLLLREADLVLVLGARLDDRATGKAEDFCPDAKLLHIDLDPSELGKIIGPEIGLAADLRGVFPYLAQKVGAKKRTAWMARARQARRLNKKAALDHDGSRKIAELFEAIDRVLPPDAIVTTDVGQHQMWACQYLPMRKTRRFLSSGGMGTMGFGLPAAIGAALANPGVPVLCVSGDGSILMNVQELAVLRELDLPVTVLVLDNGGLGLVRQQQKLGYGDRRHAESWLRACDLSAVAQAFGIPSRGLNKMGTKTLGRALSWDAPGRENRPAPTKSREGEYPSGPRFVVLRVGEETLSLPMVPAGAGNHVMLGLSAPGSFLTVRGDGSPEEEHNDQDGDDRRYKTG